MPKVYVEMMGSSPIMVYWTREDAIRITGMTEEEADKRLRPVDISSLSIVVQRYFEFRKYRIPNRDQAFKFLTSELGELADELVQAEGGWVRNNPEDKGKGVSQEAGDVLMMLLAFSMVEDTWFDLIDAMFAKMASKGFPLNTPSGCFASRQASPKEEL